MREETMRIIRLRNAERHLILSGADIKVQRENEIVGFGHEEAKKFEWNITPRLRGFLAKFKIRF